MSKRSTLILVVSVIIVVVAGFILSSKQRSAEPLSSGTEIGQLAPDFKLPTVGGGEVKLSELRGKVVLVNFWATWCPPCKAEMPSMERLYAQMKDRGFELLAVNAEVDGLEILPEFLQQHPHTFPIPVDTEGDVQTGYGVFRFPESFIIDRDGKIIEHIIGARDWVDQATIEHFRDLTKG
jgi:peroxiredoxin